MDEQRSAAVTEAFVRLFEAGLIKRSHRLINWCPHLRTVLSDIEVDWLEIGSRQKMSLPGGGTVEVGVLYHFLYPVEGMEPLMVGTTRPETLLGDTAVALHPEDSRAEKYSGKFAINPITQKRIPIILDAELVKIDLGTGVVKVTPGHDASDYNCGLRNNLEFLNVMNEDGTMNLGQFAGINRFNARLSILEALDKAHLLKHESAHQMSLPICSRSGDIIEPMMKDQWFLNCSQMANDALQATRDGRIVLEPASYESTWRYFLENIQDWCISRQLWWGHRIPAYQILNSGANEQIWVAAHSEEEARRKAAKLLKTDDLSSVNVKQDEDVLDTWFSSSLFPISAFGWPNLESQDFKKFYPLDVMETGSDILFFWVARMMMMCHYFTGEVPFKRVFLHPIVRDSHGRKMSKSVGNVLDPIEVVEGRSLDQLVERVRSSNLSTKEIQIAEERIRKDYPAGIPECGADPLRFALCTYLVQHQQINIDIDRVILARNFCNKIWQVTRFYLSSCNQDDQLLTLSELVEQSSLDSIDRWILSELHDLCVSVNNDLKDIQLGGPSSAISRFLFDQLCSFYVEFCKPAIAEGGDIRIHKLSVLKICLDTFLRLAHPFIPFVTEELWQRISTDDSHSSIMIASYPTELHVANSSEHVEKVQTLLNIIQFLRDVIHQRSSRGPRKSAILTLHVQNSDVAQFLGNHWKQVEHCVRCGSLILEQGKLSQPEHADVRFSFF
eukprot:TRINITY_DN17098_c0_g2_i2.p1 TRINITY_DN17098_c0_g2~~TRINITY_DN17098_c0_g2_i2.p1  ORF type:complete len:747 (-),score=192.00 TRINITY_DN17098_c0_g2_i2:23-2203(-)